MVEGRRGRGPGKKPKLDCTSIRLPAYVLKYFSEVHKEGKQKAMREVLSKYVDSQLNGANDGISANS